MPSVHTNPFPWPSGVAKDPSSTSAPRWGMQSFQLLYLGSSSLELERHNRATFLTCAISMDNIPRIFTETLLWRAFHRCIDWLIIAAQWLLLISLTALGKTAKMVFHYYLRVIPLKFHNGVLKFTDILIVVGRNQDRSEYHGAVV